MSDFCKRLNLYKTNSTIFVGVQGFEGIPQNLLINVIVWMIMVALFMFLRRFYHSYGRPAFDVRIEESPLIEDSAMGYNVFRLMFGHHEIDQSKDADSPHVNSYAQHDDVNLQGGNPAHCSPAPTVETRSIMADRLAKPKRPRLSRRITIDTHVQEKDRGFFSWILILFKVTDDDLEKKSGKDARCYVVFQRALLLYTGVICALSLAVLLPVNINSAPASQVIEDNEFAQTTLSNVPKDSPLIWIFIVFSVIYMVLCVVIMQYYHHRQSHKSQITSALLIANVSAKCPESDIKTHLENEYEGVEVMKVYPTYNTGKYLRIREKARSATMAREYCEEYQARTGDRLQVVPRTCGVCCACHCCRCCHKVDGLTYYGEEEVTLVKRREEERLTSQDRHRLNAVFVVLRDHEMVIRIMQSYARCARPTFNSELAKAIGASRWSVSKAPPSDDIIWENLEPAVNFWIRGVIINIAVLIVVFFLATPFILLQFLKQIRFTSWFGGGFIHHIVTQYLATVLMWVTSALLPQLVFYSSRFSGHWFRSRLHYATMVKTYVLLLIMVLILPSLGLSSLPEFFSWLIPIKTPNSTTTVDTIPPFLLRWTCVFLPDNSAFYVNYVITSAFTGTALELLRIPELLLYGFCWSLARSEAETKAVRASIIWDFQFGLNYAWILVVFAVICSYCILCPLILPFGMVYLLLKHVVDRYNLYFVYTASHATWGLHELATHLALAAPLLLQLNITIYVGLQSPVALTRSPRFLFCCIILLLTTLALIGRVTYYAMFKLDILKYKDGASLPCPNFTDYEPLDSDHAEEFPVLQDVGEPAVDEISVPEPTVTSSQ